MSIVLRNGCGCAVAVMAPQGAAVGNPKEKIRIEPVEDPVPSKEPKPVEAPSETPVGTPVEVPA